MKWNFPRYKAYHLVNTRGYRVLYEATGGEQRGSKETPSSSMEVLLTGLMPSTNYSIRVLVLNAVGIATQSRETFVKTYDQSMYVCCRELSYEFLLCSLVVVQMS